MADCELSLDFNDEFYQKYNEEPEALCFKTNKICFPTKTQAKKHRPHFEHKYHAYFDIYPCPHCDQWHLTTVDRDTRKNRNGKHHKH